MHASTTDRSQNHSTEPNVSNESCQLDLNYPKTLPGVIKCCCIAINVLGFICAEISYSSGRGFFNFVVASSIWITGFLLFLYIFRLHERINEATLTVFEVAFSGIWVILYVIAVFWMLIYGSGVAAFFAFSAAIAHGYYGYLKYTPYIDKGPVVVVMDRNNGHNVV